MKRAALDFRGSRALVTGGTRGLGAAISRRLAALGAHVVMNYLRDQASARATLQTITDQGGTAELARANLVHRAEVDGLFDRLASAGGLDILVHNAALGAFKPTLDVRTNQWDLSMATNARALLWCAQRARPLMAGRGGRVVSVSSLGSQRVLPSYGAIGVTKAALESLTRYLALELAADGIGVNAVSAGLIAGTSIGRHPQHDALVDAARARIGERALADPDEVASVVLFLCSPLASAIVGQTIVVDRGLSLAL